ncbi:MAG: flagellar biosynthetic protein FliO [Lachnospiraceae bacterium]|nr:flagellar biosynthetic protein FliO [Lachnospiraceae bacterium]
MFLLETTSDAQMIGHLVCLIIVFVFVLVLAYFAARIAGSFQSNVINKQSNIRVIEIFRISTNKTLEIVKVGDKVLVLAVCKDNVTVLTELDADSVNEQNNTIEPINFSQILDKFKKENSKNDRQN